jgi:hypothetical protein
MLVTEGRNGGKLFQANFLGLCNGRQQQASLNFVLRSVQEEDIIGGNK